MSITFTFRHIREGRAVRGKREGRGEGRKEKEEREKGERREGYLYIIYTRYIVIAGKRCKITSRDHVTQDHVTHDHITHHKLLKSLHIQVGRSHGHTVTRLHDTRSQEHMTRSHTDTRTHTTFSSLIIGIWAAVELEGFIYSFIVSCKAFFIMYLCFFHKHLHRVGADVF